METCSRGKRKTNGNCSCGEPGSGLPVQCVGDWAKDKHDYLRRYISATRGVRAKFLAPKGSGGAAFVDLFGGPGRCCVRGKKPDLIDGSPLIALGHTEAPFSKVIVCDLDHENVEALRARSAQYPDRAVLVEGDCNLLIDQIVSEIPPYGFNMALIDPFGASPLRFETISKLASFRRMDLIINWPTGDLMRIPDKMNAKIGLSERPGLVLATRQGYLPCRSWPEPDGWEDVQGRLSDERSELALDILPAIWHARRRPAMTRSSSPI